VGCGALVVAALRAVTERQAKRDKAEMAARQLYRLVSLCQEE